MTELILPALTLAAAIALTYLFCVRPMRNGRCGMSRSRTAVPRADPHREQAEIDAARAQLAAFRAGQQHRASSEAGPGRTDAASG